MEKASIRLGTQLKSSKKECGANVKIILVFNDAIVQFLLLYGSDSCLLIDIDLNKLKSLHNRCACFIIGTHMQKFQKRGCIQIRKRL